MLRKIYFMGIKGVGMASLAIIAKEAGFIVAGSDVESEFITDSVLKEKGIEMLVGFDPKNPEDFFGSSPTNECLMIITGAHKGFDNPESEFVTEKNIKVITHGEAVGLFMSGEFFERKFEGISVSGSHGKTTISAMLATFLTKLDLNPSYSIGTSDINPIGPAGHFGSGKYFVAEADEYMAAPTIKTPKFLYQYPKFLIINNIDFDHPDFFADINAVKDAFRQFIENLDQNGTLIVNGDDERVREIIKGTTGITGTTGTTGDNKQIKVITYGTGEGNEFKISNFKQEGFSSQFSLSRSGVDLGEFNLSVPGFHNAKNVLAAIVLLIEIGISIDKIAKVLPEYLGSKRRLEMVGQTLNGSALIDDYAHHPEEIRKSLEAVKQAYPSKKITVIFQAHTYGRTKSLEQEFVSAFAGINELIIMPTFASARSETLSPPPQPSPLGGGSDDGIAEDRRFVEKVRALNPNVKLIENRDDVVKYLTSLSSDNIILTMGAGDVYKVAEKLITQ